MKTNNYTESSAKKELIERLKTDKRKPTKGTELDQHLMNLTDVKSFNYDENFTKELYAIDNREIWFSSSHKKLAEENKIKKKLLNMIFNCEKKPKEGTELYKLLKSFMNSGDKKYDHDFRKNMIDLDKASNTKWFWQSENSRGLLLFAMRKKEQRPPAHSKLGRDFKRLITVDSGYYDFEFRREIKRLERINGVTWIQTGE